ncbi:MAG: four-carbon acid sugar kinase family protein [Prevotella sp.]
MLTVIADDITGAAEIAGIASKYGLDTIMTTHHELPNGNHDVIVFATDTRSSTEQNACVTVTDIANNIKGKGIATVFKKTDSVLRGHIIPETTALMNVLNIDKTLLLPQNPSKRRVIDKGLYLIDGITLDKTAFSYDPEYPAKTANVTEIVGTSAISLGLNDKITSNGIYIADASSAEDIDTQLAKSDKKTLIAGGADVFSALLRRIFPDILQPNQDIRVPHSENTIIVCGSTQSKPLTNEPYIKDIKAKEELMPDDVFAGADATQWINRLTKTYISNSNIIIGIGSRKNGGKQCAMRLKAIMADAVAQLAERQEPSLLIIEGGATAYSIISRIGWDYFNIVGEYAPGVVGMTHGNTHIILKPGSYAWGSLFTQ